jgi:nucleoside-diphosphate-sugar epimerase
MKGSIGDVDLLRRAVSGVDAVVHLAALLPPASERDRDLTMAVNLDGTQTLLSAIRSESRDIHLVFSSSVCVYGDTYALAEPIQVERPPAPHDIYGESKAAAETTVRDAGVAHTILRISGVSVPAFLAPPPVWPFLEDQRIEYVCRDDVVRAMFRVATSDPHNSTLHIAGGRTWRMTGREYVAQFNEVMGLEPEDAVYASEPGSFGWYDTTRSQALLGYQETTFQRYLELLGEAIEEALGGWE